MSWKKPVEIKDIKIVLKDSVIFSFINISRWTVANSGDYVYMGRGYCVLPEMRGILTFVAKNTEDLKKEITKVLKIMDKF
jgi:hypothetical protein